MIRYLGSTTLWVLFFAAGITILTACNGSAGNADEGARWYRMYNCYACHGENGNNGRAAQIGGLSMSFRSFLRVLRKPGTASMPPFPEEKVSKEDAADIYTWLKSMKSMKRG